MIYDLRESPFLVAVLFSLSLHGLMASLLIPSAPQVLLKKPFSVAVVWENSTPHHLRTGPGRAGTLKKTSKLNKERKLNSPKIAPYLKKIRCVPRPGDDNRGGGNDRAVRSIGVEVHKNRQKQAYHPLPKYPWVCRKRRQEGVVSLKVTTNEEGRVIDVNLFGSSGHTSLDEVALEMIKSWIFAEGRLEKTLSIAFRLKG